MTSNANLKRFLKDSNYEKYLLPFLSPTSPGTQFWESQPPGELTNRQIGRICLQLHQLVEKIYKTKSNEELYFLDIGTGNGLIPKLLPYFISLKNSHGCDPFLDGEHQTSFQKHDRNKEFNKILNFLEVSSDDDKILKFENYSSSTGNEHFYGKPTPIKLLMENRNENSYKFFQIGAHELSLLEQKYNYFYCKAIEHIPDWDGVFKNVQIASSENSIFYLKHKSFFSYLGAHRYGSTGLPWGHLRMTDTEYQKYVEEVNPQRSKSMSNFFFKGLSFPRNTIGEMIKIASKHGWKLGSIEYEKSKHIKNFQDFLFFNNGEIYKEIKKNYDVSHEELLSGIVHIVFTN